MRLSLVLCAASALVAVRVATAQQLDSLDTAAFEAVIRYSATGAGKVPIRVDPRPFRLGSGSDQMGTGRPAHDSRRTAARRAVLARLHIDTVDALVVGMNSKCPSGIAAAMDDDTTAAGLARRLQGCPRTVFYVLAVGSPHAVKALEPPTDSDTCFQVKSCWTVRVQRAHMTPYGANMQLDEYYLERSGSAWRVIKSVGLMIVE